MPEERSPTYDQARPGGELIAVRHGQSIANLAFAETSDEQADQLRRTFRDADIALSPHGREQATRLGAYFAHEPLPQHIFSSPYLRATETASLISAQLRVDHPIPIHVDERLRDREMGQLELMTPRAIDREFPSEAQRRKRVGDFYYRPPCGESLADVALRLRGLLRDIHPGERSLVVCHDAVVLMLRYLTESVAEPELGLIAPVANASVSRWRWSRSGQLRLTHYNGQAGDGTFATVNSESLTGRRSMSSGR